MSNTDWFNVIGNSLNSIIASEQARREAAMNKNNLYKSLALSDLKEIAMLGSGTFGRVTLVKIKGNDEDSFALKAMQKAQIVEFRQQKNVQNERDLMVEADHPFILRLVKLFKTIGKFLCYWKFVSVANCSPYCNRQNRGTTGLPLGDTQFYGACVSMDLLLHEKSICYRDLKPENLLIDAEGYIKIVDFGFAKKIYGKSFTLCGTPEYHS